jgi:hypothetical protein
LCSPVQLPTGFPPIEMILSFGFSPATSAGDFATWHRTG